MNDIKMKHQNTIIGMNYMNIKKTDNTINKTKKAFTILVNAFNLLLLVSFLRFLLLFLSQG